MDNVDGERVNYSKAIEILDLKQVFTEQELQKNYKGLAKKYHPDNSITGDEQKFILIKEAYEFLSNPSNNKVNTKEQVKSSDGEICPMCKGNGWRRVKIKTSMGYVAQKEKCSFCKGIGRK